MASNSIVSDRASFEKRRNELEPLVEEFNRIDRILSVWESSEGERPSKGKARRTSATAGTRAKRGSRSNEFVSVVGSNPGITVADAAKEMNVNPNYLYRLAADLLKSGKVRKDGSSYHPVQDEAPEPQMIEQETAQETEDLAAA